MHYYYYSMRVSEIILISYRTPTNNHHSHGEHQTPQTRSQRANGKILWAL